MFTVREATETDFAGIVALLPSPEELYRVYPRGTYPFTLAQLRAIAAVRTDLTVVLSDDVVVGFANLYGLEPGRRAFIGNVVIARRCRGQGIGRQLVAHMVALVFDQHGLPEAHISVFGDNTPALLLYARFGFVPYGIEERQDPVGRRLALIHMALARDRCRSTGEPSGVGAHARAEGQVP